MAALSTVRNAQRQLEQRLEQIAQRLIPCPIPQVEDGWDLCAHCLPWPCPTTEAAWIARGLDPAEQVSRHLTWLRGELAEPYADATLSGEGQ